MVAVTCASDPAGYGKTGILRLLLPPDMEEVTYVVHGSVAKVAIPRQGGVKIRPVTSIAQPFHAVVDHPLACVRPLLFRHMRLSIPIAYAFGIPLGSFGPYLLFGRSAEFGRGIGQLRFR